MKILDTKRKYNRSNDLNTNKINLAGETQTIYINEKLTPYNWKLLLIANKTMKPLGVKYIWSKNGRIYMRKGEGEQAQHISSEEDVRIIISLLRQ